MFFIQFEATPRRNPAIESDVAGALINCWVERATLAEAIDAARAGIAAAGWIVDEPDEAYPVNEGTYPPGKAGREYFEQALVDREVFVFHCFPDADEPA